jgi:hypothetical protein
MDGEPWEHSGTRPRYLVVDDTKTYEPHDVDPHYNGPGDWVCRTCGEKIKLRKAPEA